MVFTNTAIVCFHMKFNINITCPYSNSLPGLCDAPRLRGREVSPMAGGFAAGKMGKTGEVCRDIRGTGGAVGGLGMEGWAGAMGGNTTLVLIALRTDDVPLMTVLVPPSVGKASPGGAC